MTIKDRTDPPTTLNVMVNLKRRAALQDYATKHGISLAEATRRAIDALLEKRGERAK